MALFGNAAFALTFCAALMYLIQERQLKARHLGAAEFSDCRRWSCWTNVGFKSILFGFPLLTLALISGSTVGRAREGVVLHLAPARGLDRS